MCLFECVMCSNHAERNPHLIDEHDGKNGLVDEPGFAAGGEERQTKAGQKGHLSHVSKKGKQHNNTKVGRSSAERNLREALDSLQDDIELSPLAGTNGNTSGLNKTIDNRGFTKFHYS